MNDSDNIHHLRIARALTPVEMSRADAIELLEMTIADVRAGEIDEVVILGVGTDADGNEQWMERAPPTLRFRAWLGQLQLLGNEWIERFRGVHG